MKIFISLGLLLLLILPTAQAAAPDSRIEGAKREKRLVWWATLSSTEANEVIKRFNRRYPFVEVEHWRATGEVIAEKIWAEFHAKRHTWDVVLGGENRKFPDLIKAGILQKWSVPGLANVHKQGRDRNGYWVVMGGNVIVPAYNTTLVPSSQAPRSWEDLLDPKWKGKLAVTTDVKPWVVLAQPGAWEKEKVRKYISRLAANKPQIINGHTQAVALLAAGEFAIAAEVYLYRVRMLMKKGAPVDWARVNPVLFTGSAFILSKNAPHPNAAYLWLDWIFSDEGNKAVDEITGKGNPFPGSGTQQAEAIKGLSYVGRDDGYVYQNSEFANELSRILGIQ